MRPTSLLTAPSGRELDADDQKLILQFAQAGVVQYSETPFTLKSGIQSHVYVFGRNDITDNPELEYSIGLKIARMITDHEHGLVNAKPGQRHCLIGIPTAGTALAQAAAMVAYHRQIFSDRVYPKLHHRVMREQKKQHGAHHGWVDGEVEADVRYWIVDNVVTNAGSKGEAIAHLAEDGYPVRTMPHIVLIDRQQGGVALLEQLTDASVLVAYNLLDIAWALSVHGIWAHETVRKVDEEINAHQFR